MRLRVFLFKRAIHTIITLLIVLVLLFIIFRLMPGDPTRFFIEPGQTEETRNQLLVKFGFRHWVDAPGKYREVSFKTEVTGPYKILVNVTDENQNKVTYYASYNTDRQYAPKEDIKLFVSADQLVTTRGTNDDPEFHGEPEVRFNTAVVGQPITVNATARRGNATHVITVMADVVHYDPISGNRQNVSIGLALTPVGGDVYTTGPLDTDAAGLYEVTVTADDVTSGTSVTVEYCFAVNEPDAQIALFDMIEEEGGLFTYPDEFTETLARVRIAVESVDFDLAETNATRADIRAPNDAFESGEMIHPQITAERNIFEQFWVYFTSMLTLDFGDSFYSRRPVWTEILQRAPPTILLFGTSLILQAVFGVLIGVLLAWRRGTRMELSAVVVSLFFYSMPLFWFGIILIWLFAFQLGWFPFGGMVTPELSRQGYPDIWSQIADVGSHMVLPLITLMMVGLAFTILLMRNSMLEVLGEDYITTAKAKGLSERTVMYKHAARNAMLPVVTVIAISVGGVVSGGVLTETIFSWPGMGFYLVQSTLQQDYPAVQGVFFLLAVLTILANVAADVLYAFMDPRVRL